MTTYKPGDNVGTVDRPKFIRVYTTCDHEMKNIQLFSHNSDELITAELHGVWIEYHIPITDGIIAQDMNLWERFIEPSSHNSLCAIPRGYTLGDMIMLAVEKNRKIKRDILITKWEQTHK
jgi:hypothetical protein